MATNPKTTHSITINLDAKAIKMLDVIARYSLHGRTRGRMCEQIIADWLTEHGAAEIQRLSSKVGDPYLRDATHAENEVE